MFQFNEEIIFYSDDDDGDYLDSSDRLVGSTAERNHKNRKKERKCCPTLGIVLMCILVSLYIILCTSISPARHVSVCGWDENTSRDIATYILPNINTAIIEPQNVCNDKLFLLIIVCSSADNYETRQSIRKTWGNTTEFNYSFFAKMHARLSGTYLGIKYKDWHHYSISSTEMDAADHDFSIKILFLLGQTPNPESQVKINTESEMYGDLIYESFLDTYNNLTLKTVMIMKWVNRNCLNKTKFLMKCDDDMFVNVPNLLHVLLGGTVPVYKATRQEYDRRSVQYKELLLGFLVCNAKPITYMISKWYAPTYMFSGNVYPDYLSGTSYVMSIDVAEKLYKTSFSTPLFHLEDVYLTGICAKAANVKPQHHRLFNYQPHQPYNNICELKGTITKHHFNAKELRKNYEFVANTESFCP